MTVGLQFGLFALRSQRRATPRERSSVGRRVTQILFQINLESLKSAHDCRRLVCVSSSHFKFDFSTVGAPRRTPPRLVCRGGGYVPIGRDVLSLSDPAEVSQS
eukprot:Selendium_serpulae@DN5957_c1_g3_i1.p1